MKHNELVATITKQTGKEPTQQEIADILGLTRNAISSRAFRDKEYSYSEVEKLENAFKINFSNQGFIDDMHDNGGEISVDYYPDVLASCGGGAFELSNIKEKIRIPKMCIEQYMPLARYSVINAYGDSMQPTILSRDKLIVEFLESKVIKDNNIYIFYYNDRIFCKRLVQNIDSIVVISDNPDKTIYPTSVIEKENMNDIYLIGRIVGLMRGLV
jgi:phage repressor protein C with HTH and peptisase S24 domain